MKFQVQDILDVTGGELLKIGSISGNFSISTDTRSIIPEEIFLPIVGVNFDGHDFINAAIDRGSRGYFLDKKHKQYLDSYKSAKFAVVVDDTLEAYLKLANYCRKKISPVVIAVTGSSGKTTTKEIIYSVLSGQYRTHKSKLNHNNEIGLCQTLLSMPDDTEFLVVEMGMRAKGEIELLSKYAEPDIAVISNVGTAHIGILGSVENIAKAKCEIVKYLHKEGTAIVLDDDLIKKNLNWNGKTTFYSLKEVKDIVFGPENSKFIYKGHTYKLNVSGEYNILNALAAIEIGLKSGIPPSRISEGLSLYRPIENRWQVINLESNIKVINDSYNANPDSVKASINSVITSYPGSKIILVLGDMAELGKYEDLYHQEIGRFIENKQIYELVTIGEKAAIIAKSIRNGKFKIASFTNNNDAIKYLRDNPISDSVILLKASRCMSLETIAKELQEVGI